jgi:hypothetical protein
MKHEANIVGGESAGDLVVFEVAVRLIRRNYRLFTIATVLGVLLGFPLAHLVSQQYVASMTVTSARYAQEGSSASPGGGVAISLFSQIGGTSQLSDFDLYLEMLTSTQVSGLIFKDHPDLVRKLYKGEWHGDHWGPPNTVRYSITRFIDGLLGIQSWSPPDPLRLSETLGGIITSKKDLRDPIAVISTRSPDRQLAVDLLTAIHDESEASMRASAVAIRNTQAEYLEELLKRTQNLSISDAVTQGQVRELIGAALSRSPAPFAADFISPPSAPAYPDHKVRQLTPVLMGIIGFVATFVFLLVREWWSTSFRLPTRIYWTKK